MSSSYRTNYAKGMQFAFCECYCVKSPEKSVIRHRRSALLHQNVGEFCPRLGKLPDSAPSTSRPGIERKAMKLTGKILLLLVLVVVVVTAIAGTITVRSAYANLKSGNKAWP